MKWQASSLPPELIQHKQFALAGKDKQPQLEIDGQLVNISIHQKDLLSYADACSLAVKHGTRIGFILREEDPLVCIDLDVKGPWSLDKDGKPLDPKKYTTSEQLAKIRTIVDTFGTYGELSASGYGVHLWLQAELDRSFRRDNVEVYCKERFIICTGIALNRIDYFYDSAGHLQANITQEIKPVRNGPDTQVLMNNMTSLMIGESKLKYIQLEEKDNDLTDQEIYDIAASAENGVKFENLCNYPVHQTLTTYNYPSQSEADLALLSIIAFYTDSNEQVRRLFRCTELGQREKATKNNRYLDYALNQIRSRQADKEAIAQHGQQVAQNLANTAQQVSTAANNVPTELKDYVSQLQNQTDPEAVQLVPEIVAEAEAHRIKEPKKSTLTWPPGIAGAISWFLYENSQRPIVECAITATLAFMSGVAGKAFNISNTGLNNYYLFIAPSGTGKSAISSGIGNLFKLTEDIPGSDYFYWDGGMASPEALMRHLIDHPSFVHVRNEIRKFLEEIADAKTPASKNWQEILLNAYSKSDPNSKLALMKYAKSGAEKDLEGVYGANYTLVGELTPEVFYDLLSTEGVNTGWFSRFDATEYVGPRPPRVKNPKKVPDENLIRVLKNLVARCSALVYKQRTTVNVDMTPEAEAVLDEFDYHCDDMINKREHDIKTAVYVRAHLKALKVAAVLAVADNCNNPTVGLEHAQWAIDYVKRAIDNTTRRIEMGDIGEGDTSRLNKVKHLLSEYMSSKPKPSYDVPSVMHRAGVVSKSYLQRRIQHQKVFAQHRQGSSLALTYAINSLIEHGVLDEIDKKTTIDQFGTSAKCYRILKI